MDKINLMKKLIKLGFVVSSRRGANQCVEYNENYKPTDENIPDTNNNKVRELKEVKYKHEIECRLILHELFPGKKFDKIRPSFLKNPKTNKNMEIDCFNEELKLALEYNGIQHYKYIQYFHEKEENFITQQERDKYKYEQLIQLGYNIIIVSYDIIDIKSYIIEKLKKYKLL